MPATLSRSRPTPRAPGPGRRRLDSHRHLRGSASDGRPQEEEVEVEEPQPPGRSLAVYDRRLAASVRGCGATKVPHVVRAAPAVGTAAAGHRRRCRRRCRAATSRDLCPSRSTRWAATGPRPAIVEGARLAAEARARACRSCWWAVPTTCPTPAGCRSSAPPRSSRWATTRRQGVRRKKDSSLVRAAEMVRDGTGLAPWCRAGNTGATMASRAAADGAHQGRVTPGHRHARSRCPVRHADGDARRRRQRRVPARVARPVRPDGQRSTPATASASPPAGRPAVHRRGGDEGQPPGEGDARAARRLSWTATPGRRSSATSRAATS